jgi:cytochrome c(L)
MAFSAGQRGQSRNGSRESEIELIDDLPEGRRSAVPRGPLDSGSPGGRAECGKDLHGEETRWKARNCAQLKCKTAMIVSATLAFGDAANSGIASAASDVITSIMCSMARRSMCHAKPREAFSEAVIKFHKTGQNPCNVDSEALGEGKDLYTSICQTCHVPDGSGRIGPSLIDRQHHQIATDIGLFEIVFGDAGGAMQPFSKRLSQDQILKVIVYVCTSFIRQ